MTRASVLHEVRQMRVEELYARQHRRELTRGEAAEILGVAERTFRRWRDRYDAEGHTNRGSAGPWPARRRSIPNLANQMNHMILFQFFINLCHWRE
jgi:transposase-like protein